MDAGAKNSGSPTLSHTPEDGVTDVYVYLAQGIISTMNRTETLVEHCISFKLGVDIFLNDTYVYTHTHAHVRV